MKEISFYQYIQNKDLPVGTVKLDPNSDNRILFTKLNQVYLHPRLWSIITNDFYIFSDFERYLSQYKHYKQIILQESKIKKISQSIDEINGTFFLFGSEENYWHFLIDFIPRLICLKYIPLKNIKVIIPDNLPDKYLNFIINVCSLININNVVFYKLNQENLIYNFEKLYFVSKPSIEFTSSFLKRIFKNKIINKRNKNLYVKRGKTPRRKVLNESEVINVLKEYHYDVIDCYELTIEEQIDIFSQSRNIIMPSGAAMANLIFVPDNINVVEIRSNLDGDYSNKINLQNRFSLFLFENTEKIGDQLRKDIIINIDELRKFILKNKIY